MPFEIFRTTAEDVIGATDATLQIDKGVADNLVADFLDIPNENASNALHMAQQLDLIMTNATGDYIPSFPYATYLVTGNLRHRAAILRFVLEQYEPYKTFKMRLHVTGSVNDASRQVKALYSLNAHRGDILSTLVSLGTYTNSLVAEGAGRYKVPDSESHDYLSVVEDVVHDRAAAELHVRRKLGEEAATWINLQEVFNPLVTAYQRAAVADQDPRAPIVYAGNAIESFLVQVADHFGIAVHRANGINAKADQIAQNNHLTDKHKFMVKYLGHIRNAADHGIDASIGRAWEVSTTTSIEYVHVAQSVITTMVAYINNRFTV